jgi:hypothetical protein
MKTQNINFYRLKLIYKFSLELIFLFKGHIYYALRRILNEELRFDSLSKQIKYFEFKFRSLSNPTDWKARVILIDQFLIKVNAYRSIVSMRLRDSYDIYLCKILDEFILWLKAELKDLIDENGNITGTNKTPTLMQHVTRK